MRLDKIRFARVISLVSRFAGRSLFDDEMQDLDAAMDIEVPTQTNYVPVEAVDELLKTMAYGEKIPAIKAYRVLTGAGLKESKDAVEKRWQSPVKPDTRVDSMLKKIDEQIGGVVPGVDYVLSKDVNTLHTIKDFIKSFYH